MTPPATPATIAELPFFVAGRFSKPDLVGRSAGDGVEHFSGRELVDRVRDLSLGLSTLGMAPGDHVALLSESRPEWLIADFAILAAGAVTIPIYPTLSPDQVAFILSDSRATLAIVSSPAQFEKVVSAAPGVPSLRAIVLIDPVPEALASPVPVVVVRHGFGQRSSDDCGRLGGRPCVSGASPRRPPGRSRDDHLHVRHDRRAEGRHAHPRQPGRERRGRALRPGPERRGHGAVVSAALPRVRAHGRLRLSRRRRVDDFCRVDRHDCARSAEGPTHRDVRRAARVREAPRACAREGCQDVRRSSQGLRVGAVGRRAAGRTAGRRPADSCDAGAGLASRRRPGVREDPRRHWRPAALGRVRQRAAQPRHRQVLPTASACRFSRATG